MKSPWWAASVAAALLSASAVMAAPSAHADTLPSSGLDQNFATGQGDWTQSTGYNGLCVPALLCSSVTNSFESSGGADGTADGYIETSFGALASTGAATEQGIWTSPAFDYDGFAGAVPASVDLDLDFLPKMGALLALDAGNSSSFAVVLVDQRTQDAISVVPSVDLGSYTTSDTWIAVPSASVDPSLLTIGDSYQIRVTTTLTTTAAVATTGSVGYDDVRLTTVAAPTDTATGPGTGTGANGGTGITTLAELRKASQSMVGPGSARVLKKGHLLQIRLRCPASASPLKCRVVAQGLARGTYSLAATHLRHVGLEYGTVKKFTEKVRPAYWARYAKVREVALKLEVQVGKLHVVVRKKVHLLK